MRALWVFAVGLVFCSACENPDPEDGGLSDTGVVVDTGVDSGAPRDAGVDAGFPDAAPDASPVDADPTDVDPSDSGPTDVTPGDGGPRTGPVTIIFEPFSAFDTSGIAVFSDATGAIRATRTTTVGLIVETIEEGWMVTLAREPSSASELLTITEIAPNETYKIAAYALDPPEIAPMYFENGGDPYPGATSYWSDVGCFGGSFSDDPTDLFYLSISEGCVSPTGTIDFVVVARDNNLDRLAFKLIEDVPVVANATVTITSPWRTDFTEVDIVASNAPVGADYMSVQAAVVSNGTHYDYDSDNLVFAGGAGSYTLVRPPFGDGLDTIYELRGPGGRSWLQKNDGAPMNENYDLGTDFLPFPGPVTVTPSPILGRPNASWQAIPGVDFVAVQVLSFTTSMRWTVFARGDVTSFTFPELPPELARLSLEDLSDILSGMRVIDADAFLDYAAARAYIGQSVYNWADELNVYGHPPPGELRGAGEEVDFK